MIPGTTKRHSDPARAEARRNQIMDAAEVCFQQWGFHGASMSEISQAAGMSAGHIYNYFESKEAIIAAIAQRHAEEIMLSLDKTCESGERLIPGLQSLARRKIDECSLNCHVTMMFEVMAEAARNSKMSEIVCSMDRQFRERLIQLCHHANVPWSDEELSVRVDVLLGFLNIYAFRSVCNPDLNKEAVSRIVCHSIELLFEGLPSQIT